MFLFVRSFQGILRNEYTERSLESSFLLIDPPDTTGDGELEVGHIPFRFFTAMDTVEELNSALPRGLQRSKKRTMVFEDDVNEFKFMKIDEKVIPSAQRRSSTLSSSPVPGSKRIHRETSPESVESSLDGASRHRHVPKRSRWQMVTSDDEEENSDSDHPVQNNHNEEHLYDDSEEVEDFCEEMQQLRSMNRLLGALHLERTQRRFNQHFENDGQSHYNIHQRHRLLTSELDRMHVQDPSPVASSLQLTPTRLQLQPPPSYESPTLASGYGDSISYNHTLSQRTHFSMPAPPPPTPIVHRPARCQSLFPPQHTHEYPASNPP